MNILVDEVQEVCFAKLKIMAKVRLKQTGKVIKGKQTLKVTLDDVYIVDDDDKIICDDPELDLDIIDVD